MSLFKKCMRKSRIIKIKEDIERQENNIKDAKTLELEIGSLLHRSRNEKDLKKLNEIYGTINLFVFCLSNNSVESAHSAKGVLLDEWNRIEDNE